MIRKKNHKMQHQKPKFQTKNVAGWLAGYP
jgi:hypothetical protein